MLSKMIFKNTFQKVFTSNIWYKTFDPKGDFEIFQKVFPFLKKKKNTYEIFTKTLLGYFSLKKKLMKYLLKCKNPFIFSTYNSWDFHQKPFYAIFIQKLVRF